MIKVYRQPVSPAADHVAAPAGILFKQTIALAKQLVVRQSETSIATGNQPLVGDVLALRGRVTSVAGRAEATPDMMRRMTRQAELSTGGSLSRGNSQE
jgi:hypothetical protein